MCVATARHFTCHGSRMKQVKSSGLSCCVPHAVRCRSRIHSAALRVHPWLATPCAARDAGVPLPHPQRDHARPADAALRAARPPAPGPRPHAVRPYPTLPYPTLPYPLQYIFIHIILFSPNPGACLQRPGSPAGSERHWHVQRPWPSLGACAPRCRLRLRLCGQQRHAYHISAGWRGLL